MTKNKDIDNSIVRIGIDLGTTNSEVAICLDDDIEIVKCNEGIDYTPSVFGFDKSGNKIVGHRAYKKYAVGNEDDLANIKKEVKRLMGTGDKVSFPRVNKKMLPEEISAEILKSLKEDVVRKSADINARSAVITVPAYFDSVQNEATVRAGKLAGFEQVILLQEPIAAAMAYGFKRSIDANWLVYDFGGGTFDVALISSSDGMIKVVEHGGDNFLGGKDIDREIVERVIKPKLEDSFSISSFSLYQDAALKYYAEEAKKNLTNNSKTTIEIDNIGTDDEGEEIYLSFDLTRERFNEIIEPIVNKTIDIMKEVVERSSVKSSAVSRIILVGGPTQIPYVRERIAEEMRIDVETSVDPLTTVARGACVYGMGQRVDESIREDEAEETLGATEAYRVELNYEAMTSNDEEVVSGTVSGLPSSGEFYIRINSDSGSYNSATIPLKKSGAFYDTLIVEPGKSNRYWLYLTDSDGNNLPIYPDNFTITHGLTVRGVPIPHGIGVIYGKWDSRSNEYIEACDEFFARGDILPLETTKTYTTLRELKSSGNNELPIEVYEGDYTEPRSNKIITKVSIDGKELPHSLPKDTDLELTIRISESREVYVEAYIPSIDKELNARVQIFAEDVSRSDIKREVKEQRERIEKADISEAEKNEIKRELREVENSVSSKDDTDSNQKASREIDKIRNRISDIANESKNEGLARRFKEREKIANETLEQLKKTDPASALEYERILDGILKEGNRAIKEKDYGDLDYLLEQLNDICQEIMMELPVFWISMLYRLRTEPITRFSDPSEARRLLMEANHALDMQDQEALRRTCTALVRMLPRSEREDVSGIQAGITR